MLLCLLYDVDRFALIWVFLIMFWSRNVLQLRNGLMIWEINSVLPFRKGWLAYIEKTYAVDPDHYDGAIGQGDLVVPDDA
jgi:hypothetical protein